jgi:hypothetical protein
MKQVIFTVFLCCLVVGCEIQPTQKDDYDTSNPILVKAYSDNYKYPDGFYFETIDSGSVYYVNTVSILPLTQRRNVWIELCTDDVNEARTWSELTNQYSSETRKFISERQTEKYFEFKWINPIHKNDIVLNRVHKKSYFIPLDDKLKITDTIGRIPQSNLQTTDRKQLIEYLWSSTILGDLSKVLESDFLDTVNGNKHIIKSIVLVGGDFHVNDVVNVYENTFLINNSNGIITMRKRLLKEIIGRKNY